MTFQRQLCSYEAAPGVRCQRVATKGDRCRGHAKVAFGPRHEFFDVCPSCGNGRESDPEECRRCNGRGWVSKIKTSIVG